MKIPVIVEKSPGGKTSWNLTVGGHKEFKFGAGGWPAGCKEWLLGQLAAYGAGHKEQVRVLGVLEDGLRSRNRVETEGEVSP